MKNLKEYIKEEIGLTNTFATPTNTMGMGNPTMPTEPNTPGGSGDMGLCCIDVKTGKMYKRRKKFKRYKIV